MRMNIFSIPKIARSLAIFTITLLSLTSCEKTQNTIGSGFLDGEKFESGIFRGTSLLAYTKEKDKIKTSNSSLNLIGAYKDPIFGSIKSGFGIPMELSVVGPDFGTNPLVDSVILTMPYLGRLKEDVMIYDTDSIYGDKDKAMSFKISELTKFLHPKKTYYSTIDLTKSEEIYNDPAFQFSADSIVLTRKDTTKTGADTTIVRKIPASFRARLDEYNGTKNDYFQRKILDAQGTHVLKTNANFIEYINGLVFETESTDGAIYSFNMFKNTSLYIYYHNDNSFIKDGKPFKSEIFNLKFSPKQARVNKYDFDRSTANQSLQNQLVPTYDTTKGSDFIYIHGMSGLESKIKLFTNKDQLKALRDSAWIINKAELVYRVADDNGKAAAPPFRLLMANSDSLKVTGADYRIIDYIDEPSAFDGSLRSDATILSDNVEKRYYKFLITNHVAAILDGEIKIDDNGDYTIEYDDTKNFDIKLISFSGSQSVSRVKLNSTNNSDKSKKLFLQIHYSKKEL